LKPEISETKYQSDSLGKIGVEKEHINEKRGSVTCGRHICSGYYSGINSTITADESPFDSGLGRTLVRLDFLYPGEFQRGTNLRVDGELLELGNLDTTYSY
jgi:hypothetical protein